MNLFLLFALDCLVFLGAFRLLNSPQRKMATALRLAGAILVTLSVLLFTLWWHCDAFGLAAVMAAAATGSLSMGGHGLARLGEALGRWRFPLYLLSVATLSAMLLLFIPLTTFMTSPGEIGIHLDYLFSENLRKAMACVYVAAALYALAVPSRMKTALALLALGLLALAMLYSYLLPLGYPRMSGLMFEQLPLPPLQQALRASVDLLALIMMGLAIRAALLRFGGKPFLVGLLLINASLAVSATISISRDELGGAGGSGDDVRVPMQPLRFSHEKPNVLVIFLDRFMGSYVESILRDEPHLATALSGFTWYPRTLSAGENSIAGVHPMLGGYDYTPEEMNARGKSLRDLSIEAFSILPYNFSRKGYHVNVVNPGGLGFTMAGDCRFLQMDGVTCTHIPRTTVKRRAAEMGFPLTELSRSTYADLLVLLGAMRASPYTIKDVLNRRGPWQPFMDHSAGTTFKVWAELKAFGELSMTRATESNLTIVSNILPHEPYYLGPDCLPRRERYDPGAEEMQRRGHGNLFSLQHEIAARCALLMVADYLQFLKKEQVYDNSKIVIVSDHGIVGGVQDHSSRAVAGGTQGNIYVRSRSVLLVKDIDATGTLQTSEEFMPNAEVPRIVCLEIGGCVNPYRDNRTIAAHGRDDPFRVSLVPWQFNLQEPDAFVINRQLTLTGKDPFASEGWQIPP